MRTIGLALAFCVGWFAAAFLLSPIHGEQARCDGYAAAVDSVMAAWRPGVPADNGMIRRGTATDSVSWAHEYSMDTVSVLLTQRGFLVTRRFK